MCEQTQHAHARVHSHSHCMRTRALTRTTCAHAHSHNQVQRATHSVPAFLRGCSPHTVSFLTCLFLGTSLTASLLATSDMFFAGREANGYFTAADLALLDDFVNVQGYEG